MENNTIHSTPQFQLYSAENILSKNQANTATTQVVEQDTSFPGDKISLSKKARVTSSSSQKDSSTIQEQQPGSQVNNSEEGISVEKLQHIQKLQKRDAEVRAHEQAHQAVAGHHVAGGPSYTYEVGPNGKRYAVGGEVPIDMSKEATPEETIQKMQIVARAALAPANPSAADRRIAARAAMFTNQATRELQEEQAKTATQSSESEKAESNSPDISPQKEDNMSDLTASQTPVIQNSRRMILSAYTANIV